MAGLTDKERKSFGAVGGGSKWRENIFVGGFPGGEEGYRSWVESGMEGDVPDVPEFLQPKTEFENSVDSREKPGVLKLVEKMEFFPKLKGKEGSADSDAAEGESESETDAAETKEIDVIPSEDLYAKYFPASTRNLAPKIIIQYDKSKPRDDKVGVAMFEVTAEASDLYFPADYSGMAPFIDIQYDGSNLATAKVGVSMQKVEGLPTLTAPVPNGETITKLVAGNSGGLKLEFEVAGEGPVNVNSDPRCIENFAQKFPSRP